jgi:hypothetical protein
MVRNVSPMPNPKLEDHLLSAVSDCIFIIFGTDIRVEGRLLYLQPEDASWRRHQGPA